MSSVLRSILAVLLGFVVASGVIGVIEHISHAIFPPPAGLDPSNAEATHRALASMPAGAYLFIVLAWALGTFSGAWVAGLVAKNGKRVHALIIGFAFLAVGIIMMMLLPHPAWFMILGLLIYLPAAYAGGELAERMARRKTLAAEPN